MHSLLGDQEIFRLVGVDGVSNFVHFDIDIIMILQRYVDLYSICCLLEEPFMLLCRSHSLPCLLHVSVWSFLIFWVILVGGFDSKLWPLGVIIKPDGFEPCFLCCGSITSVEVPNYLFRNGYLI